MIKPGTINPHVKGKLEEYGIHEGDYRVKMHIYHTEEKVGVPYRMLIINKDMPTKSQTDLQLDLKTLDSDLCVVFKG